MCFRFYRSLFLKILCGCNYFWVTDWLIDWLIPLFSACWRQARHPQHQRKLYCFQTCDKQQSKLSIILLCINRKNRMNKSYEWINRVEWIESRTSFKQKIKSKITIRVWIKSKNYIQSQQFNNIYKTHYVISLLSNSCFYD